jgi:hypothetical protein
MSDPGNRPVEAPSSDHPRHGQEITDGLQSTQHSMSMTVPAFSDPFSTFYPPSVSFGPPASMTPYFGSGYMAGSGSDQILPPSSSFGSSAHPFSYSAVPSLESDPNVQYMGPMSRRLAPKICPSHAGQSSAFLPVSGLAYTRVSKTGGEAMLDKFSCLDCAVRCEPGARPRRKNNPVLNHDKLEQRFFDTMELLYKKWESESKLSKDPWHWLARGSLRRQLTDAGVGQDDAMRLVAFCKRLKRCYYAHSKWCDACDHPGNRARIPSNLPLTKKVYDEIVGKYGTLEDHFEKTRDIVQSVKEQHGERTGET